MKRHERFFAVAREAALRSKSRYRLGCVIAKGTRLVAVGTNDMAKTHPLISRDTFKMIHAEVDAVIGASRERLMGCVAYVHRERADGTLGLAKPCEDCAGILISFGVKGAYYSDPGETCGYGYVGYK